MILPRVDSTLMLYQHNRLIIYANSSCNIPFLGYIKNIYLQIISHGFAITSWKFSYNLMCLFYCFGWNFSNSDTQNAKDVQFVSLCVIVFHVVFFAFCASKFEKFGPKWQKQNETLTFWRRQKSQTQNYLWLIH